MTKCADCKHANWKKTSNGRLHPSGEGRCSFPYKVPPLPASMYWLGISNQNRLDSTKGPKPFGGAINRKQFLEEHCIYWSRSNE